MQKNNSKLKDAFREAYFAQFEESLNEAGAAHRFSKRFEEKGEELIALSKGNDKRNSKTVAFSKRGDKPRFMRLKKACAVAVATILIGAAVSKSYVVYSYNDSKITWTDGDGCDEYEFHLEENKTRVLYLYEPSYIPEGYEIYEESFDAGTHHVVYYDEFRRRIELKTFYYSGCCGDMDNDHTVNKYVYIGDKKVKLFTSNGYKPSYYAFWEEDGLVFIMYIDGSLGLETALEIVDSVKKTDQLYVDPIE